MLSVLLGTTAEVAERLVRHPGVELVAFTGSVAVGKRIASTAGYKRLVLELGGNDPLIVLDDADLDLAVTLAAEGSYRNSGQRCTAVKRILVQQGIAAAFTRRLVEKTAEYTCGNPLDEATRVGTVIDEASAIHLEAVVREAVAAGARILTGGRRQGALLEPTVIGDVPRDCRMVVCESFGPLAPVLHLNLQPVQFCAVACNCFGSSWHTRSSPVGNVTEMGLIFRVKTRVKLSQPPTALSVTSSSSTASVNTLPPNTKAPPGQIASVLNS